METKVVQGIARTKVLGEIHLNVKVTGGGKNVWDLIKYVCGLTVFEIHNSWRLPVTYELTLVSELFKRCETESPTSSDHLVWASPTLKWMTAGYVVPLQESTSYPNGSSSHSFLLRGLDNQPVTCSYDYSYTYKTYINRDFQYYKDLGSLILDSCTGNLKCRKVGVKYRLAKRHLQVYTFEKMMDMFSPTLKVKSKLGLVKKDVSFFDDEEEYEEPSAPSEDSYFRGERKSKGGLRAILYK